MGLRANVQSGCQLLIARPPKKVVFYFHLARPAFSGAYLFAKPFSKTD
jgi:hypothetical protein